MNYENPLRIIVPPYYRPFFLIIPQNKKLQLKLSCLDFMIYDADTFTRNHYKTLGVTLGAPIDVTVGLRARMRKGAAGFNPNQTGATPDGGSGTAGSGNAGAVQIGSAAQGAQPSSENNDVANGYSESYFTNAISVPKNNENNAGNNGKYESTVGQMSPRVHQPVMKSIYDLDSEIGKKYKVLEKHQDGTLLERGQGQGPPKAFHPHYEGKILSWQVRLIGDESADGGK